MIHMAPENKENELYKYSQILIVLKSVELQSLIQKMPQ